VFELGQGPHRRVLDTVDRRAGRRPQADGDGHRLVVVEDQRGHVRSRAEPVAAGHPGRGVDGVAQLAEAIDVAPQGAGTDLQALGQLPAGPELVGLQQGEKLERSGGRVVHKSIFLTIAVRIWPHWIVVFGS